MISPSVMVGLWYLAALVAMPIYNPPSTTGLISAVNISAGTTSGNLSAVTFSNANGVSFGLDGSVVTGTVATNYQAAGAYLTTAALSQDSSRYAGTNGAITGGSITVNTSGVSVNLPAYLTTAMASNRGSDFVQATAAFAGTSASGTIASGGISVSIGPYLTTAMLSNAATISNVRVSAGTLSANRSDITFSNLNGLSFGLETNGVITGSYTVPTQTNQSLGLYGSSNTTLTSSGTADARSLTIRAIGSLTVGVSASEFILSAPNALTTAMASNRGSDFVAATAAFNGTNASGTIASNAISVSVAAPSAASNTLGMSNLGNTAGTTGVVSGAPVQMLFAGGSNITLSQSLNGVSGTITVSAFWQTASHYRFSVVGAPVFLAVTNSLLIWPIDVSAYFSASEAKALFSISYSTAADTRTLQVSIGELIAIYTRTGSSLSLASSGSASYGLTLSSNDKTASLSGVRALTIPITVNASPGNYWGGILYTSSSQRQGAGAQSLILSAALGGANITYTGPFNAASNNSNQLYVGAGPYSATTTALVASIGFSEIYGGSVNQRLFPVGELYNFSG